MRLLAALAALATGCSDYDLQSGNDDPKPPRDDDTDHEVDTSEETDSAPPPDSGGDTVPPGDHPDGKIDVVLLVDVAYFYDCYHPDVANESAALIDALFDSGADVAVAVASFDDYNVDGQWYARTGGLPYVLEQQLTTDRSTAKAAAGALSLEWGGDGPGSGYEALLQAATGRGYDQDCDGRADKSYDVAPFRAGSGDAFGGAAAGVEDTSVAGTGSIPGVGFRKASARVFVLFVENSLRDAAYGHGLPSGACKGVAGQTGTADAIVDLGGKLLGVNAYEFQDIDWTPQQQLEDLADLTASRIDADGDGARDDRAVLSGSWDWPPTDQLVSAIWDLASP